MLFATVGQGQLFIWMMASGAVIGAWYLITALLRRFIRAGFCLTLACDLLFGAGSAAIIIAALIAGSYGQVRPFEILGAVLGALLFALAFAPPLKALQRRLNCFGRTIMTSITQNRFIKVIFK